MPLLEEQNDLEPTDWRSLDRSRSLCPKSPAEIWNGECQPIDISIDANSKHVKTTENCEDVYQAQFQSAVKSLLYMTIMTRPDITSAVSNVAKFCVNPCKRH